MPEELFESARIDGASEMAVLLRIVIPILALYPFIQKHFMKGVLIGAIKG